MVTLLKKKKLAILAGTLAYGLSVLTYKVFFNQELSIESKKKLQAATHNAILFVTGTTCPFGFEHWTGSGGSYLRLSNTVGGGANDIGQSAGVTDATTSTDGAHTHSMAGAHTHRTNQVETDRNQGGGESSALRNSDTSSAGGHDHGDGGGHNHNITIRSVALMACKWKMHQ